MKREIKFKKIMNWVTGAKIFCMCASALYFFFSIWRFFKLPLTEKLAPFLDVLLIPIKMGHNTLREFGENTLDVGYIVVSIVFFFLAFVFWAFQKYVPIRETQEELQEIQFKRKQEEELNKELQNQYIASIEAYKIFSIFVKLKFYFANSAFIDRDKVDLNDLRSLAYQESIQALRADYPAMKIEKRGDAIFITGKSFDRFDMAITSVLNAIKLQKNKYAKDAIMVDFIIAVDSQKTIDETELAYKTCLAIAKLEYNNKAAVTLTFKERYELIQQRRYKTDYLCNFQLDNIKSEDRELFSLKSKPTHI